MCHADICYAYLLNILFSFSFSVLQAYQRVLALLLHPGGLLHTPIAVSQVQFLIFIRLLFFSSLAMKLTSIRVGIHHIRIRYKFQTFVYDSEARQPAFESADWMVRLYLLLLLYQLIKCYLLLSL